MKFNCGPTWEEKLNAREKWHPWFAWRPIRLGSRDCRWFEYVLRKGRYGYGYWNWEYKAPPDNGEA